MTVDELYNNGLTAYRRGDLPSCAALAAQAIARNPRHGPAHLLRAVSLPASEVAVSAAHYSAATRLTPLGAEHWFNRGVFYESRLRIHDAAECYRRAIHLDPLHLGALINGTQLIRVTDSFEEALRLARRLQRLDPDGHIGHGHEAICLQHLGLLEEADAAFAEAVRRSPDPSLLHWEHHFSHLVRRNFAEAWEKYEVRFACGYANGVRDMAFTLPPWDGASGQHVLVYGEQGLGDQIMFASALPDLLAVSSKVSLAVHPVLVDLFTASFPQIAVLPIGNGEEPQECEAVLAAATKEKEVNAVLPIGSLMTHFRNGEAKFDGRPFLQPSKTAQAYWQKRRPSRVSVKANKSSGTSSSRKQPFQLGICWASNPAPERFFSARRAIHKTMPLDRMACLVQRNDLEAVAVTNVSLDQFDGEESTKARIEDVSQDLINLDRTAALMQSLDLVITVDTGIAHLAGSLGVPVWILLHKAADPRWGEWGCETSYWYKSARLFWQTHPGDWNELIERVSSELDITINTNRSGA